MPALFGRALPVVRVPGGQSEGSPAEVAQPYLRAAMRALYRLAWLREHDRSSMLVLLAWYVLHGDESRSDALLSRLTAMVGSGASAGAPTAPAKGKRGPDAAAARRGGSTVLAVAERAYAEADELACDARWLAADLEALRAALAGPGLARPEVVGCEELDARCVLYAEGSACVPVGDRCGHGESAVWRMLRDAAMDGAA